MNYKLPLFHHNFLCTILVSPHIEIPGSYYSKIPASKISGLLDPMIVESWDDGCKDPWIRGVQDPKI